MRVFDLEESGNYLLILCSLGCGRDNWFDHFVAISTAEMWLDLSNPAYLCVTSPSLFGRESQLCSCMHASGRRESLETVLIAYCETYVVQ